jgi:large subunit ribosomal protein L10
VERLEKDNLVNALKDKLAKAQSLVLVDFRGLPVDADTKMRNEFRAAGCEYRVVKNTLLGLAVKGTKMDVLDDHLKGPTAVAYSFEDPSAPAKIAAKVAKEQPKLVIKGGYVDGMALDQAGVVSLSQLPGKDELRSKFLATLQAVPQNFLALLIAAPQNFMYLLAAREEQAKDGGTGGTGGDQGGTAG